MLDYSYKLANSVKKPEIAEVISWTKSNSDLFGQEITQSKWVLFLTIQLFFLNLEPESDFKNFN